MLLADLLLIVNTNYDSSVHILCLKEHSIVGLSCEPGSEWAGRKEASTGLQVLHFNHYHIV